MLSVQIYLLVNTVCTIYSTNTLRNSSLKSDPNIISFKREQMSLRFTVLVSDQTVRRGTLLAADSQQFTRGLDTQ